MPINIHNELPAYKTLTEENIFVMTEARSTHQDIRPLEILILNLMPKKIETETQLLRLIGNSPLQVEVTLLKTATYQSKNTAQEHLLQFYETFEAVKHRKFDGMIITGAPVEDLDFEAVDYWQELTKIMIWTKSHVYSTFHICWGAQAGLYFHYGIQKYRLAQKLSGLYVHKTLEPNSKLLRGFDEEFFIPHSRYTANHAADIQAHPDLDLLVTSADAGFYLAASKDLRHVFASGHSEYDKLTLRDEYLRDTKAGLSPRLPCNYFPDDDPEKEPILRWRSNANLLFVNWLNYAVYQETPYDMVT